MKLFRVLDVLSSKWGRLATVLVGAIFVGSVVLAQTGIPLRINYQGAVEVNGDPFTGVGLFKFALVSPSTGRTLWSNDGTSVNGSEPLQAVSLQVSGGLLSIQLGDTTVPNMTAVPVTAFETADVKLRVWFTDGTSAFELLQPERDLTSVPFAYLASGLPPGSISGPELARESVWPEHRGRSNTVRSFFGQINNSSLGTALATIPGDKDFVITDAVLTHFHMGTSPDDSLRIRSNETTVGLRTLMVLQPLIENETGHTALIQPVQSVTFAAGLNVPGGSTLLIDNPAGRGLWRITISGYQFPKP